MDSTSPQAWLKEKHAETCIRNLKRHGFEARLFDDLPQARAYILAKISGYDSFGFGGSDTTRRLNIIDSLKAMNKTIHDHWQEDISMEASIDIRRSQLVCDCFFCSANAIALSGEIVNVDGAGNRTSAMAFGPKSVVIVAGVNKLTPDLPSAINRVREIAAPLRAKSLGMNTPCAETGVCSDCNAPQRICRITTILHRKPMLTDVSVLLVREDLGY